MSLPNLCHFGSAGCLPCWEQGLTCGSQQPRSPKVFALRISCSEGNSHTTGVFSPSAEIQGENMVAGRCVAPTLRLLASARVAGVAFAASVLSSYWPGFSSASFVCQSWAVWKTCKTLTLSASTRYTAIWPCPRVRGHGGQVVAAEYHAHLTQIRWRPPFPLPWRPPFPLPWRPPFPLPVASTFSASLFRFSRASFQNHPPPPRQGGKSLMIRLLKRHKHISARFQVKRHRREFAADASGAQYMPARLLRIRRSPKSTAHLPAPRILRR